MAIAVEMRGITKRFGSMLALENVDLTVEEGTLHAVVGENGAGKTTLMNILYGLLAPDAGSAAVLGDPIQPGRPSSKIGMVSQHYGIIPELSNLENLILSGSSEPILNYKSSLVRAANLARELDIELDWQDRSENLSPGQAQQLEILKLLWRGSQVLILDEPTAMVSPELAESLYRTLLKKVEEGFPVIVVTHRVDEVLKYATHVSALRAGRLVGSRPASGLTASEVAEMMIGENLESASPLGRIPGAALLEAKEISIAGDLPRNTINGLNLNLRENEIVGIAGVEGNGQRELIEGLLGVRPIQHGELRWKNHSIENTSVAKRLSLGFRVVPADRQNEAIVADWSLEENARLGRQRSPEPVNANAAASRLGTKFDSIRQKISSLSGGNQQRFVLGRALLDGVELILAVQPARGLDVLATRRAYQALRETGKPCLVVGYDLDELMRECDRLLVMHEGRLYAPPEGFERDRATIGRLMTGAAI